MMRDITIATRSSSGLSFGLLSIFLLGLLSAFSVGCVDPFQDQTTTAKKVASERNVTTKVADAGLTDAATSDANGQKKKPKQTYKQAWHLICHAERLAKPEPTATRQQRKDTVAQWLVAHLKNTEARYWFISFGKKKRAQQPAMFLAETDRVGIQPCPLYGLLFDDHPQEHNSKERDAGSDT